MKVKEKWESGEPLQENIVELEELEIEDDHDLVEVLEGEDEYDEPLDDDELASLSSLEYIDSTNEDEIIGCEKMTKEIDELVKTKEISNLIEQYDKISKPNFTSKMKDNFDLIFSFDEFFSIKRKIGLLYQERTSIKNKISGKYNQLKEKEKVMKLIDFSEEEVDINEYETIIKPVPNKLQQLLLLTTYGYDYEELTNHINSLKSQINTFEKRIKDVEYDITVNETILEEEVNEYVNMWLNDLDISNYDFHHLYFATKKVNEWITIGIIYDQEDIIHRDIYFYNQEAEEDCYDDLYAVSELVVTIMESCKIPNFLKRTEIDKLKENIRSINLLKELMHHKKTLRDSMKELI